MDTLEEVDQYIKKVDWKKAKTYRKTAPHEYTIRDWRKDLDDEFVGFAKLIRRIGTEERFYSKTFLYFYHGDYKYWTMGDPLEATVVLNRCLIKDYPDNKYKGS
jgi:hypothetical protein